MAASIKGYTMPAHGGSKRELTQFVGLALYKPSGRKPRAISPQSDPATCYGDLNAKTTCDVITTPVAEPARWARYSIRMHLGRMFTGTVQTESDVVAALGSAFPHRLWSMENWTEARAPKCNGVHGGPRYCGGARIGFTRIRVSMMCMAAPQCRHTKVGCTRSAGRSTVLDCV